MKIFKDGAYPAVLGDLLHCQTVLTVKMTEKHAAGQSSTKRTIESLSDKRSRYFLGLGIGFVPIGLSEEIIFTLILKNGKAKANTNAYPSLEPTLWPPLISAGGLHAPVHKCGPQISTALYIRYIDGIN